MPYDIHEHRHRFSAWAAARAAQRGFSDVSTLSKALEACGVREFLATADLNDIDTKRFDVHHRQWCKSVVSFLEDAAVSNVTFGRAAKLVAIYIKGVVVLGPGADKVFAHIAHPPIDGILLRKLASSDVKTEHSKKWAKVTWTRLNEAEYYELIGQIRQTLDPEDPFWMLEQFWNVTNNAES